MKTFIIVSIIILAGIWGIVLAIPRYPLAYSSNIEKYAEKFDLEPELVASVIFAESSFRKNIVSKKGAIGLMQILPSTAQEVANKLQIEDYKNELLYNADMNILIGCCYLRTLIDKFGNEELALLSYNAGPTTVIRWLRNEKYSNDGKKITSIPYSETRNYLKKINNAKKHYQKRF